MKATVYLALGSNLGDRVACLCQAVVELLAHPKITLLTQSSFYETEHWPKSESSKQPNHLNQVLKIETELNPSELLRVTQAIENHLGKKKREHWGVREIDLDLLLYDDLRLDSPELTLPHQHLKERKFVLVPLLEIAPDLVDPLSGERYCDILGRLKDEGKVTIFQL